MIHSIAVPGGDSPHLRIAQRHAIQMARLFQARVRVVVTWDAEDAARARAGGAPDEILQSMMDEEMEDVSAEAGATSLVVERSVQGIGLIEGVLATASESDLLVVGLTDQQTEEHALLTKAECLVLAVHREPTRLRQILVDYQGGKEGKAALRIAGELALRAGAAVTILCVSGDTTEAGMLAATARRYLEAFGPLALDAIEHTGSSTSRNEVFHAAKSVHADLIVVGQERRGFLAGLLGTSTLDPDVLAEDIDIPVLIAA